MYAAYGFPQAPEAHAAHAAEMPVPPSDPTAAQAMLRMLLVKVHELQHENTTLRAAADRSDFQRSVLGEQVQALKGLLQQRRSGPQHAAVA